MGYTGRVQRMFMYNAVVALLCRLQAEVIVGLVSLGTTLSQCTVLVTRAEHKLCMLQKCSATVVYLCSTATHALSAAVHHRHSGVQRLGETMMGRRKQKTPTGVQERRGKQETSIAHRCMSNPQKCMYSMHSYTGTIECGCCLSCNDHKESKSMSQSRVKRNKTSHIWPSTVLAVLSHSAGSDQNVWRRCPTGHLYAADVDCRLCTCVQHAVASWCMVPFTFCNCG